MQALSNKDNSIILMIQLLLFIDRQLGLEPERSGPGRPAKLSDLEALTILAFDGLVEQHQTLRGIYNYIRRDYGDCFHLPTYQNYRPPLPGPSPQDCPAAKESADRPRARLRRLHPSGRLPADPGKSLPDADQASGWF